MAAAGSTMERLLRLMAEKKASDIYLATNAPISIRINGNTIPVNQQLLDAQGAINLLSEEIGRAHV